MTSRRQESRWPLVSDETGGKAAGAPPPRKPHEESRVHWKHLFLYGVLVVVFLVGGGIAIWSFIERQMLVIAPEPLPKVSVVTSDPSSPLAASWVKLLTRAEMSPTLVPIEKLNPIEGVVVFCGIREIPPALADVLTEFTRRGGAIVFAGMPPPLRVGDLELTADRGVSDDRVRFTESVSPLLARLNPGNEVAFRPIEVALLKESPRMMVDARWSSSARAAIMHMEADGGRYLWFGIDPDSVRGDDRQLMLLLRSAFRWVAGQPVSDGAVGSPQVAKTLTPNARREARSKRFAFSVDRLPSPGMFSVRMANRGREVLLNPTVKVWLPPGVTRVSLAGNVIMRRSATLTGVPEDGACLVSLPRLTPNEDRVLKLRIVETRGQ